MATINSLLFLFSTLAPNVDPPGNYPVTQPPSAWIKDSVPQYAQNDPVLRQMNCRIGEALQCDSHCQKNCSNYDKVIPCPDICVLGCVCIGPFIRAWDGSCIMPYECPATPVPADTTEESYDINCDSDEEISTFPHCQRNCTNYDQLIICPDAGAPGCVCKSPKIRGPDGTCITPEQCPGLLRSPQDPVLRQMNCRIGEALQCDSHCQKNCSNYDKVIPCPDICVLGCVCIGPFIRASDGSCIMPYECPATPIPADTTEESYDINCDSDEEISTFPHCQRNCTNYDQLIICPDAGAPGCVCKSPKIRGPDGTCITPEQCPGPLRSPQGSNHASDITCPPNEEVSCFSHCQPNCTTFGKYIHCPMFCKEGCVCKRPMIRGPDGSCIMPYQCAIPIMLKSPSKVSDCLDSQECDDENKIKNDDDDYKRTFSGLLSDDEVCPESEEYKECGTACQKNCENYERDIPCVSKCQSGCFCKEPMIRGPEGKCIYKEECPEKLNDSLPVICAANEEYKVCGTACQKSCQNYDANIPCEFKCQPGCYCKEPLIRGPGGDCILKEECPAKVDGSKSVGEMCAEDEEYKVCGTACQKNCQNYDESIPCELNCEPGCFCREPLVRGPGGRCVRKEECPTKENESKPTKKGWNRFLPDLPKITCLENEEFSLCAQLCPDDCSNYKEFRFCQKICAPGCRCIKDYVKNMDGVCIKKEECEKENSHDCGEHETYKECGSYCETDCYNHDVADRKCEDNRCKTGCFCESGLVRSPDGKCIPPENCPTQNNSSWGRKFLKRSQRF